MNKTTLHVVFTSLACLALLSHDVYAQPRPYDVISDESSCGEVVLLADSSLVNPVWYIDDSPLASHRVNIRTLPDSSTPFVLAYWRGEAYTGWADTLTRGPAPVARAGRDRSTTAGEWIVFDGTASHAPDGHIRNWNWDFGDGTQKNGGRIDKMYEAPGNYVVRLKVFDDTGHPCGTGVTTVNVVVAPPDTLSSCRQYYTTSGILESVVNPGQSAGFGDRLLKPEPEQPRRFQVRDGECVVIHSLSDQSDHYFSADIPEKATVGEAVPMIALLSGPLAGIPSGNVRWETRAGNAVYGRIIEQVFGSPGRYIIRLYVTLPDGREILNTYSVDVE